MANQVVRIAAAHAAISPTLFHEYAAQFLRCERACPPKGSRSPVRYFLLCRAVELELKARHLLSKSRAEVKREFWHDLKRAYDGLPVADRVLTPTEYDVLVRASAIYKGKGFEYVSVFDAVTALKAFPQLAMLRRVAAKLVR